MFGAPSRKGGVENQPITTVLGEKHFERRTSSFICSAARLASLPTRKWSKEFLATVEQQGKKDPQYQQTREGMREEETLEGRKTKERESTK